MSDAQPGWYPDPSGAEGYRWWDGQNWTDHIGTSLDASPPDVGENADPTGRSGSTGRRLLALGVGLVLFVTAGVGVGLVVFRESARTGPAAANSPGPTSSAAAPSALRPRGEVEERSRRATIGSATMVLPEAPYQLYPDPSRVAGVLDVLFAAHAPVHRRFDGQHTWSAMVGFAALDPRLVSAPDLDATAGATLRRLSVRFFGGRKTTVRKVSYADHTVDGRAGVMITGQVHYDVARLRSRYDRVTALVVRLDDGVVVTAVSSVPNDADAHLAQLAAESLESLRVR